MHTSLSAQASRSGSGSLSLTRPVKGCRATASTCCARLRTLSSSLSVKITERPAGGEEGGDAFAAAEIEQGVLGADGEAGEQFAGFAAEPAIQHRIAQTAHAWRHRFARRSGTGTPALEQGADHAGMLCKAAGSPCAASSRKRRRRSTASLRLQKRSRLALACADMRA